MNLTEIAKQFVRPESTIWTEFWCDDEFIQASGLHRYCDMDFDMEALSKILQIFPVNSWRCSDTNVGLFAICMGDSTVPVCFRYQPYRKSRPRYFFPSQEDGHALGTLLMNFMISEPDHVALYDEFDVSSLPSNNFFNLEQRDEV